MMKWLVPVLCMLLTLPCVVRASVRINEVAWMGTDVSPNKEWIELYNTGPSAVDVSGWVLSDGVSLNIALTGAVPSGGYALLERTDEETVPGVSALLTYTGALSNDGRTLTLKRGDGGTEDQVAGGSLWANIGGDNTTKDTPQYGDRGWVTAPPTPGRSNSGSAATAGEEHASSTASASTSSDSTKSTQTITSRGASGNSAKAKQQSLEMMYAGLSLVIQAPKTVYENESVPFEATASGLGPVLLHSLVYTWNFGDAEATSSKKTHHTFRYPGEYLVVLHAGFKGEQAEAVQEITVLPRTLSLSRSSAGDLVITNDGEYRANVSNFVLRGNPAFQFPSYSYLKPGGSITLPRDRVGNHVTLYDVFGHEVVSEYAALELGKVKIAPSNPIHTPVATTMPVPVSTDTVTTTPTSEAPVIVIGNQTTPTKGEGWGTRIWRKLIGIIGG